MANIRQFILATVRLPKAEPIKATLQQVADEIGCSVAELDPEMGVVPVDPERRLFAVMIDRQAHARARLATPEKISVEYANPEIAAL